MAPTPEHPPCRHNPQHPREIWTPSQHRCRFAASLSASRGTYLRNVLLRTRRGRARLPFREAWSAWLSFRCPSTFALPWLAAGALPWLAAGGHPVPRCFPRTRHMQQTRSVRGLFSPFASLHKLVPQEINFDRTFGPPKTITTPTHKISALAGDIGEKTWPVVHPFSEKLGNNAFFPSNSTVVTSGETPEEHVLVRGGGGQGSIRRGGRGVWDPEICVPKSRSDFPNCTFRFFPRGSLWSGGGGGPGGVSWGTVHHEHDRWRALVCTAAAGATEAGHLPSVVTTSDVLSILGIPRTGLTADCPPLEMPRLTNIPLACCT